MKFFMQLVQIVLAQSTQTYKKFFRVHNKILNNDFLSPINKDLYVILTHSLNNVM